MGDLLLSGYRIFGHIKTSQGGHQLTNLLLSKLIAEPSNWELVTLSKKQKDQKNSQYDTPIAVNA